MTVDCSWRTLLEDLCWDISAHGDADWEKPAPRDEMLQAYRNGQLSPAEEQRLERWLAGSQAGRQRLAELAGVEPAPPLEIRKRVLAESSEPKPADWYAGGVATTTR